MHSAVRRRPATGDGTSYLSGVLGFSDHAQSFRVAQSYTSDLSGLIYIQRLLFLECAVPLRSYPSLGISCRPRMELLGRLDLVRRRYMVAGSEFPFAEMMSLRHYGRKIARFDTPAFLLRWSTDGLTVFLGDNFCVSRDQFRLLPTHFISQARHLCAELMFGWEPPVDLYSVRDDLSNICSGYSSVQHPQNRLRNAHLQLRCRSAKAADGSSAGRPELLPTQPILRKRTTVLRTLRLVLGVSMSTLAPWCISLVTIRQMPPQTESSSLLGFFRCRWATCFTSTSCTSDLSSTSFADLLVWELRARIRSYSALFQQMACSHGVRVD